LWKNSWVTDDQPIYASAYDPQSNLRLARLSGPVQIDWLIERQPSDPTLKHLPDCLTIVDLRGARLFGAPSEVTALGEMMRSLISPNFQDRYVWLIDLQVTVGMTLAFWKSMGGEGRIYWFEDVEPATAKLGVTVADFERVESMLVPIEGAT
jgi:hypothetical protein